MDAYGHALSLALAEVYDEPATVIQATIRVAIGFEADGWYGARTPEVAGAIADIVDFSRILCFGSSFDGEPFCFDFRNDPGQSQCDLLGWRCAQLASYRPRCRGISATSLHDTQQSLSHKCT